MDALRGARLACAAGKKRTRNSWPTTTVAGSRRTGTSSVPRTAATGRSATTPSIESDGEPMLGGAITSGEPRTATIWSEGEQTTAAIGRGSEPEFPTHLAGQTTAHRHRSLDATMPRQILEGVSVE
jgi:hypothetical protein